MIDQKPKIQIIGGPCSAESEAQILQLAAWGKKKAWGRFRAGLWKPRTRPGSFDGVGQRGLSWLKKAEETSGLPTLTEVATPRQAEQVLNSGISGFWIGARTSLNPFYVQEIAEVVKGADVEVWIKNPIHPDLDAWVGAVERMQSASVKKVGAIHRGFFVFRQSNLRNSPVWSVPLGLRRLFPELEMFCDISHIAGHRDRIGQVMSQALHLNFSGIMAEVHESPASALTDADQQIDPKAFESLIEQVEKKLITKNKISSSQVLQDEEDQWREAIQGEIYRLRELKQQIPSQMDELIAHFRIDKK